MKIRSFVLPIILLTQINAPAQTKTNLFSKEMLDSQVSLARNVISPGAIDGKNGFQTKLALKAFQEKFKLKETGALDKETKTKLKLARAALTSYTISEADLLNLAPIPKTWLEKAAADSLNYETVLELLGEKFHTNTDLIKRLNPNTNWTKIKPYSKINVPDVQYPMVLKPISYLKISLIDKTIRGYSADDELILFFPTSIGRVAQQSPVGELMVTTVAINPTYLFDPDHFPESEEAQSVGKKLTIPAGPNNPVGFAWIGLNAPSYGIHGTPLPELVGRTESHGCFRLANWDALFLAKQVKKGLKVIIE